MKTSLKHVVKEFQRIHGIVKDKRKYRYTLESVGECTGIKSIVEKDGVCLITSGVMIMITGVSCSEILKIFNLDIPAPYSPEKISTVTRFRRSRNEPLKEVYSAKKHFYRKPDFNSICAYLVENHKIPADSKFEFSEGSYRRDGSFYNRIIRVDIELSEIGQRIFLIDEFLNEQQ